MNRKVESKLTRSIWIDQRSCFAWPSRDPRSKCYTWCTWENSSLCIPCILWWKTQDFSKIESGPNYTTAAHAFVKATLRLGFRAPFVARNYSSFFHPLAEPNEPLNTSTFRSGLVLLLLRLIVFQLDSTRQISYCTPVAEVFGGCSY